MPLIQDDTMIKALKALSPDTSDHPLTLRIHSWGLHGSDLFSDVHLIASITKSTPEIRVTVMNDKFGSRIIRKGVGQLRFCCQHFPFLGGSDNLRSQTPVPL